MSNYLDGMYGGKHNSDDAIGHFGKDNVVETPKYGYVTVNDIMIETNGTNLESGVEILDEMDFPLCEVIGYNSDELISNPNLIDELIDCYS